MDEFVYSLLLKGTQGLTLLGTLRFRFLDLTAAKDLTAANRARDVQALMGAAIDRSSIALFVLPAEGSISVPLLSGLTPVPISGIGFGSPVGLLTVLLESSDDARRVNLQINPIDAPHIGGGLSWQLGQQQEGELLFSVLGTRLELAM